MHKLGSSRGSVSSLAVSLDLYILLQQYCHRGDHRKIDRQKSFLPVVLETGVEDLMIQCQIEPVLYMTTSILPPYSSIDAGAPLGLFHKGNVLLMRAGLHLILSPKPHYSR